MKIYKKNHHSLFIKPFGMGNNLYFTLTVFIYFDLTAPNYPLTEQELWKTIPEQLKPVPILDVGMSKPHGEVIVTGSCFSPRGTTRQASMVSVAVGKMKKELAVFGDRYWKMGLTGLATILDPVPFSEMPVIWGNAFGGREFADNPAGKGIDIAVTVKGGSLIPLPNIEYIDELIAESSDQPKPAGFGPLDVMLPVRQKKTGTYDDKWLKERWPYFPDDMNYEFFNCAPEDQYIEGFFSGGETIEIINMHPDIQRIQSHVPELRIRCFVTKQKALKSATEMFQEVPTCIDTLWLFPAILRGVAMFRGTTEIVDEEYEDVSRIFIATEQIQDAPGTLEHYLEEQKKAMDLSVPVDMAPLQNASKKIGDMMKRIKKIPQDIDDSIKMATGRAPVMPRTPAETAATGQKVIADSITLLNKLEAQSRGFHEQYGHLMKFDLSMFEKMRGNLLKQSAHIDTSLAKIEKAVDTARKDAAAAIKSGADKIRKALPADLLEKAGFNPEALLEHDKKVNPWHDRGFPFAIQCRRNLEGNTEAMKMLNRLGIGQRAIKRAWLGINLEEMEEPKSLWGITCKNEDPDSLAIPAGLVMPRFNEAVLNRVLILPPGWEKGEPFTVTSLVEGSDKIPLFFFSEDNAPVIVVADELQALFIEQEIGDACSIIVLAGPDEKPSKEADDQIKKADIVLIILPEKSIDGRKAEEAWKKTFPDAILYQLPKGRTVFEARKAGIDIRQWIMEVMPKEFIRRHKIAPEIPEPGKPPTAEGLTIPVPALDVKAIIDKAGKEIRGYLDGKIGDPAARKGQAKAELLARVGETLKKAGFDPEEVLNFSPSPKPNSIAAAGDSMTAKLALSVEALKKQGVFTPDIEQKFNEITNDIKRMSQEGQTRFDAGMAKLEAAKKTVAEASAKTAAQEMPRRAKAAFAKYGMDPDRMVKRTREEVIAMYARGESLAFAILSGIDLSGLDLHGIDLNQAQCMKTNFADSILDGADFTQVMAKETDFTGCSMKGAKLDRSMLIKARLKKTDLGETSMKQTIIKDADLTDADLTGAVLELTMIMNTPIVKARLNGIRANLTVFSDGDASDMIFKDAKLERCLLRRLTLDRADFSHTAFPSTTFMEVTGNNVIFYGADMHKCRMSNNTILPGADMRDAILTLGSLRDTDLSGADFTGTKLDGALIEKCSLKGAKLSGISAKACRFSKSDLEGADMRYINLFGGSVRKSRLVNTDLRESNLYAVDFYKAIFGETRMDGANIKKSLLERRTGILKSDKGVK